MIAVLPLLLVGCTTWEGSWLLTVLLAENSVDPDAADAASEEHVGAVFYEMDDGSAAVGTGRSDLLVGAVDGEAFSFGRTTAATYSSTDCAAMSNIDSVTFNGDFTGDGGLSGTLRVSSRVDVTDCDFADASELELRYTVDGIHVNAHDDRMVDADASWGYSPYF